MTTPSDFTPGDTVHHWRWGYGIVIEPPVIPPQYDQHVLVSVKQRTTPVWIVAENLKRVGKQAAS